MGPLSPLPITLPRRGSRALLSSLHNKLRLAILDGRLKPGIRLPSTRALAAGLGVSRNTAVATYDLLLSEGYVSAHRGSGNTVANSLPRLAKPEGLLHRSHSQRILNPFWRRCSEPLHYYPAAAARFS